MIVKNIDYEQEKDEFFKRHHNAFNVTTKGQDAEYYTKTYTFEDQAIWYEVMRKVTVEAEGEIYFCKFRMPVELFETEYWSTDNSKSNKYYEPWSL